MKRLFTFILLIVCLLAVSVECLAQYPYSHVEAGPGIVSPAIVRYYPGNRGDRNNICNDNLVVYYEESNVGHVAYSKVDYRLLLSRLGRFEAGFTLLSLLHQLTFVFFCHDSA